MKTIRRVAEKISRNRTLLQYMEVDGSGQPLYLSLDTQLEHLKMCASAFYRDFILLVATHLQSGWELGDVGADDGQHVRS